MHEDIIKKILESIDQKSIFTETYPKFSGQGYRAHKIEAKNFHEIKIPDSNKRIAFIDGGNAEIIGSANFSLSLIRVCYVIYENKKKISSKKFEMFAFVRAVNENNEITYKTEFFNINNSLKLEEISFSSFDPTLMLGMNRADISSIANAIRRFAELKIAKSVNDEQIADITVLDGNLQSTLTNENKYLNELYESCETNNVVLTALSKTNSIFTENGNLLGAVLSGISPVSSWSYHPIVDIDSHNHKAEMLFVKLHDKSKHIFRFEIFNIQKIKAEETINDLAGNCVDPVFIGYPYGLVEADRMARVSNQEKEMMKTMLMVKIKDKNIERYLSANNAHEILDRVSF